jgi:hypothetical protein
MSIKVNDTVKVVANAGHLVYMDGMFGKVVKVYDCYEHNLAIVEFPGDVLSKIPLDALVKVEPEEQEPTEGITITRAQFRKAVLNVCEPNNFITENDESLGVEHVVMSMSAGIACAMLEKILFGAESDA